jgi:NADPH:quinone reductase-like Zn-dependent oxidoreductase
MKAAIVTGPGLDPVCADFPEPTTRDGSAPLELVATGIHQVVRGMAAGTHYGAGAVYPHGVGIDAVARTPDGRLVYTGWPTPPFGTMAERMATRVGLDLPAGADPLAVAAGMNPAMAGWLPLAARHEQLGELGTVAVLGATGAAGGLAVREAFALGARRVVAAGRDPRALEALEETGAVVVRLAGDHAGDAAALAAAFDEDAPSLVLDLLRARRLRVEGSGAGSVSTQRMLAELPRLMELIADGTLPVAHMAYPLSRVGEAWAHHGRTRAVVVPD